MSFPAHALRSFRHSWLALGLAMVLGSCTESPARPVEPVVSPLTDAGVDTCAHPDEGCPCDEGDEPVECFVDPPIYREGRLLCQHGTRVCRQGAWSACENITLYAPTNSKILGAPGAVSTCRPDDFTQNTTPDGNDLTPGNSTNLENSTLPPGVRLETIPPANVVNYGLGPDSDGDGVPDSVDDCPMDMTRWRAPCSGPITEQGFFHILLPGASATDPMQVNLQVRTVDAYLLIDTTMSMNGEIANLRTGINGLMSNIQSVIPGANLGIGMYRDFPVSTDSNNNDFPYQHLLDPTSSLSVAQSITNQVLDIEGNYYWPENGANALYSVATGRGLGTFLPNRATCPNGGFGWPCFRPGTVPVVIMVTDAPFWNGPSFATTDTLRRRTELSYAPYPGTRGTDAVASANLPPATVVSSTGQIIISNDTVANAFEIGDMTNRSLTVQGSNNGVTTALANNFTETCGGRSMNGPDVFYEFSITQGRHFILEAFGDFDPTLYLRRVSGATASTMACNLDSGSVADGNGGTVWRTGSRIDTRTIPGVGATTTNVTLTGCNASATDVPIPMTGCDIATSTTNADLTGCTVPTATFTSNLSGCAVDNTPTVSTFTGCSVPSSTTSTVSGCSFESTTTSATLTGCTAPTTNLTSNFTGCQIAPTTTTNLSGCTFPSTTTSITFSGCNNPEADYTDFYNGTCTRAWTQTTNLTGCSIPNVTTTASYTHCNVVSTVQLTNCDLYSGDDIIWGCDAYGVEVGTVITGSSSGIPAGTTIAEIVNTFWGPRIRMSAAASRDRSNITVTDDVTNYLTGCRGTTAPQVGMTVTGNTAVLGASGRTISSFSGAGTSGNPYILRFSSAPSGSNGDCGGSGSGACSGRTATGSITAPLLTRFQNCTVSSGSAPANGMRLVGTGLPGGATISSVSGSGPYTINISAAASSSAATLTGLQSQSNTLWENCSLRSGDPPAVGMVLDIDNGPSGTTTITSVSGTGPYTIGTSQAITSGSADIEGADAYNYFDGISSSGTCRAIGTTSPTVGMAVTGTNIQAGTVIEDVDVSSRYCAGSNGTGSDYCQSNCTFNSDGTCSGCTYRSSCNGVNSRWFRWADVTITPNATSGSASLSSASSTTYDLTRVQSCTIPMGSTVPAVGWTLGGTGLSATPTIASISGSGTGPYTIGLSTGAALSSSSTVTSAVSGPPNLNQFINCTLTGGSATPTNGMRVTMGTNLGMGTTTINGTPTLSGGRWTIPISPAAANSSATLTQTQQTVYTTNRVQNCTLSSGTLQNGQTVTGTGLSGTPVISNLMGSGSGPYTFDFGTVGTSNTAPTYSVTGATITTPNLNYMVGCNVTGLAPATGDVLGGTNLAVGATVASATGTGPYRINFSAPATSSAATLTSLTRTTAPQLDRLTGCVLAGGSATPAVGMELAGSSLVATGAPIPTITSATLNGGTYTILMSRNATGSGAVTSVTGTSNSYTMNRLVNCTVSGDPLQVGMALTGTNLAPGSTVSAVTPTSGGRYAITLSANATATNATATSGTITVNYLNRLTGCTLSTGSLATGMGLTGSRLAAGTLIAGFTGSGSGPYTINLDRNATSVGATTAMGALTVPLPQLVNCQGSFLLDGVLGVQGPNIAPGTTVTGFGGLGTAGNPWVINLSTTPTGIGTNLTIDALMPGLGNQLTGCMIASGGPLIDNASTPPGMAMSGTLIAPGSTLLTATGSGSGPYTLTLSDTLTGMGATDAFGTITIGASGGASPLAPGTYQLVVDSSSTNAASATSPGRGTFQLRMTNLTTPPTAANATQPTEVPWATTVAAMNAAGIKTIGVASCPAGCTDLATRQDAYATCVQGAAPTTTTGADNISLTNTYCGATYNRCINRFGAAQSARCVTVFNECRRAEISAGQQNLTPRTEACNAAQSSCNTQFPGNATNCTSVYNYCRGTSPAPATSAVCTTQASSVSTCLNAAAGGSSDAAVYCDETIYDLGQMGVQTGSVRSDGTPFVYQIAEDGSGLSATIADGVRDLARYILFDVTALCEDPNGTGACGTLFSNAVIGTPSPVGLTPGCNSCSGPTCLRCTPGAQLPYQINFLNSGVGQTNVAQTFEFFIVLRDATGAEMSRAPVRIVVPPDNPSTVAPTGSFRQIYDATLDTVNNVGCPYPSRRADWGTFTYSATITAGTNIRFEFRTAETVAGLASATPVSVPVTATVANATVDVGQLLVAAGQLNYLPYVQVTAVLNADSSLTRTPVLESYNMEYTCVDIE